jgi:formate hydrogenlyase subunit 3/multisubunit Na+/H+ antiporter MnhD subunit
MTAAWAIALVILLPLAAAALAFAFPRRGRWLALATALMVGIAIVPLTREVLATGSQVHRVGGWSAPLGIDLRADGLSVLMLLITALIGLAVALHAQRYLAAHEPERPHETGRSGRESAPSSEGKSQSRLTSATTNEERNEAEALHRERYFWPLFLLLWTALNALFLSADIFNLYVALELLGFAAVTLVALAGKRAALTAALRYLFVSLSASLFYLLGVGLVYGQCATVDLASLAVKAQPGPTLWVALALMTGGLLAKAALFPLHFWLPPAHANAPAPVSALLSALVVKGSFYILLRLWFEAFPALLTPAVAQLFGALGAAAVLWGSINALFQTRLKLLIAYSTVAQLGYLFLLFPLAATPAGGFTAWSGGLIFLGAHACAKTAMFLTAGNILHAAGHDRIQDLDGITHVLPVSVFAFALAGTSLIGLPPSSGFAGKWLLLNAALAQGQWWWVAVVLLGSLLAAAYVVRVLAHAFTQVSEPRTPGPIPRVMEWTALALALLAVVLGFASQWLVDLLRVGAPVAGAMMSGGATP